MVNKNSDLETAVLAVNGIVLHENRCLFLYRNNPPIAWCPPGGRVEKGETLHEALHREVFEESGLKVEILCPNLPFETWKGPHDGQLVLALTYICKSTSDEVKLSNEHSQFQWISVQDLVESNLDTYFEIESWPRLIKIAEFVNDFA